MENKPRKMTKLFNFRNEADLSDFTLIISSVSVGNVPQLTVDLLISSLDFNKTATIWHPALISSVGADPYDPNNAEICTACELYVDNSRKLALIQIRSAIDQKLAMKFFEDLKEAIIKFKIKDTIILTSSFDYEMHVVTNQKFCYISNQQQQQIEERMSKINVKLKEVDFTGRYKVHGSGFAVKLFELLNNTVGCTVLIKHVSEGDNRPDAVNMVEILSRFVDSLADFDLNRIKFPCSWSGVFGGPPPIGIY